MAGSLARFYGWTYNEIAEMTPEQCIAAVEMATKDADAGNIDSGKPGLDGNLHFSTKDEWDLWRQTRGLK